jgi:serine-type D-Ala-D-Ala carboxypeptidase/endopeptidase
MPDAPGAAGRPGQLEEWLREQLTPYARRYVGLVAGARIGDETATLGFGWNGQGDATPDQHTSFQIGSVTKVFTALLLADAVARGEVALEQPLVSLIPETASHPKGRQITLLDLATHGSGLPRLPPGLWRQALRDRADPYAAFTTDDLVAALARPPKRPPTERARYTNFGAGALGEALSRAAGVPYEELARARITGPLGMPDTAVTAPPGTGNVAVGHTRRGSPTVDWHLPALAGAGALRSNVADLLTFLAAHLQPATSPLAEPLAAVLEPRRPVGRHLRIALGWLVLEEPDRPPVWWHNGGTGGFFSFVGMDPARDTAVVVVANSARSVDRVGMTLLSKQATLEPQ